MHPGDSENLLGVLGISCRRRPSSHFLAVPPPCLLAASVNSEVGDDVGEKGLLRWLVCYRSDSRYANLDLMCQSAISVQSHVLEGLCACIFLAVARFDGARPSRRGEVSFDFPHRVGTGSPQQDLPGMFGLIVLLSHT